jgi:hypothetical protein
LLEKGNGKKKMGEFEDDGEVNQQRGMHPYWFGQ